MEIVFGLASTILVARVLGPTDKGILDLFRLLISFIGDFGLLGIGSSLLYFYANRGIAFPLIHGTGLLYVVLVGGLTILLGITGMDFWLRVFPSMTSWMILAAFAMAPFIYYRGIWASLVLGIGQPLMNFLLTLIVALVNLLTVLALIANNMLSATSMIFVTLAMTSAPAIFALIHFLRYNSHLKPNIQLGRNAMGYGLVIYVSVIANLLHFRIDQLMVASYMGTRAVGLYAVSVRFAEMILLLDTPISSAALKRVSGLPAAESHQLTHRINLLQIGISGGAAILVALLANPVINLLLTPEYAESVMPLILLMPGVVAWSSARILSQYITYNRGKVWYPTAFSVTGLVLNIILNSLLIPRIGITGASVASSISYGVVATLTAITFHFLRKSA